MSETESYIKLKHPIEAELYTIFGKNEELTIFDIGCCELEDSIRYSNMFEGAKIFSFEALTSNFLIANENKKKFGKEKKIQLFNFALSNKEGEADFHVSSGKPEEYKHIDSDFGNKSSSLLAPHKVSTYFNWLKFNTVEKVKTRTLNDFCELESLSLIDLMHIDVQGAELLVLQGATNVLSHTRAIWIEVETEELYKDQPLKKDVESYLSQFGLIPVKTMIEGVAGDILFLNKKYFEINNNLLNTKKNSYNLLKDKIKYKLDTAESFRKTSYSQSGEDLLIKSCLGLLKIINPTYIDIGANHPFHYNNTAMFYEKDCRGINVEPNTGLYDLFKKFRKHDVNLNVAISDKPGEIDYFEFDTQTLNTCSESDALNYEKLGYKIKAKRKIKAITVDEIIKKHHSGIFPDVLTIDVEGLDEKILRSLNLKTNYPKVICVETVKFDTKFDVNNKSNSILSYLIENGYQVFADTYINTILVKK